ncbi:MAG: MBL fold metallo-hydrolase [Dehalococcoidia bacterium]
MTLQRLTDSVYAETGMHGCNHGFVTTSEGVVMIDTPQKPSDAVRWRDEIAKRGDVRYLILTEPHPDHCTTGYLFSGTMVSHQGTREWLGKNMLGKTVEEMAREWSEAIDPEGVHLLEGYYLRLPTITFRGRLILYLGDHTFEIIHMPGHTSSQTAVYIPEERVVFTGDNVFYRVQTWLNEAYPQEWLHSLERIWELDVDVIVPGHGDVCDKSYLKEQASFIREWMCAVKRAFEQGLTKEEAQTQISFLDRYPMDTGLEFMDLLVQQLNVARLYDLVLASQPKLRLKMPPHDSLALHLPVA